MCYLIFKKLFKYYFNKKRIIEFKSMLNFEIRQRKLKIINNFLKNYLLKLYKNTIQIIQ